MHAHELLEGFAAVTLVASGAFFLPASWLARRKALAMGGSRAAGPSAFGSASAAASATRLVTVSLLLAAAVIHAAVVPEHLAHYRPFGIAFAVAAALQVLAAVGLLMRPPAARVMAIGVNLVIIAVWAVSRSVGLPIGPDAGVPEAIGAADLATTVFQATAVLLLLAPIHRLSATSTTRLANALSIGTVPLVGTVGLIVLIVLATLGTSGPEHEHAASSIGDPAHAGATLA